MREEELKGCLEAASRGDKERETATKDGGGGGKRDHGERQTEAEENWARVVELFQTAFRDGDLAEEATWQAVVLILKGKGYYRGIGLVCQVPVPKCRLYQLHDPRPVLLSLHPAFSVFTFPPLSRVASSLSLSPRRAAASHPWRSSARILDGPPGAVIL